MSRLEELIQQYCPDGVEYYKIKDVYKRIKGTPITAGKMKEIATPDGSVRIFAGGKTVIDANEKDIPNANITRVPAVLVQSRGVIDAVYYDKPFTFKNEMWAYTTFNQKSVKYLYYILKSNIQTFRDAASGMGSLPQISLGVTEEFEIPVPPLPIQEEIVRILDNFTELQAELQAELQKRKQQYNYYLDNLLSFNSEGQTEVKWMKIGDICDVFTGGEVPMGSIKGNTSFGSFIYPIWGNGKDIYGYATTYQIDKDAVCISSIGANSGAVFFHKAYFTPIIRLKVLIPRNQSISVRYLFYILSFVGFDVKKSSVPNMNSNEVRQKVIPVPPLAEQQKIVSILDRFDTLTNDLTAGLPAEIEKRRQQYEYYRDKLLTFKRKEA